MCNKEQLFQFFILKSKCFR